MNNEKFWKCVDKYESGELNKKELYELVLKLNNGNEEEARADYNLAIGE